MADNIDVNAIVKNVGSAISQVAARIRKIETQVGDEPTEYLVAGSHLTANSAIGALSVNVSTFPAWAQTVQMWVLIDAGNNQAEVRQITAVDADELTLNIALEYAHSEGDPVIFLESPDLNIKWFGATGDAVTDDSPSIQATIDQLEKIGGGIARIPAGSYLIGSVLTVNADGISIIGAGGVVSILVKSNSLSLNPVISIVAVSDFQIVDLTIFYSSVSTSYGIYVDSCDSFAMKNVRLTGGSSHTNTAVYLDTCSKFILDNILVMNFMTGIQFESSTDFIVSNCHANLIYGTISTNGIGFRINDSDRFIVSHNTMNGSYGGALNNAIYATFCDYFAFLGNTVHYAVYRNFVAEDCSHFVLSGNSATANIATGGFALDDCANAIVQGNTDFSAANSILLLGSDGILISGQATNRQPIFAFPEFMQAVTRSRISNMYSEFIPALAFNGISPSYSPSVNPPVLTRYGPGNDDPYVWRVVPSTSDFDVLFSVVWRIPHNIFAEEIYITPIVFYEVGSGAAGSLTYDFRVNFVTTNPVSIGYSNQIYDNYKYGQDVTISGMRIDPWHYYTNYFTAYNDLGRTKDALQINLSISKTDGLAFLAGDVYFYGMEFRFSDRMDG